VVAIVIVAHSHKLAEGVKELADQMSQGRVPIAAAGGLDEAVIGTNMERILEAINAVYQPDGVLVLMDLGSAVLSTELAVEMLPPEQRANVLLSAAPLVEGAIAAAVEASIGSPLTQVEAAARAAMSMPKVTTGLAELEPAVPTPLAEPEPMTPLSPELILTIPNKIGLHARPAALFVQTASEFQADIRVRNLSRHTPAVNAKSIFSVLGIGARYHHQIGITAQGPDADEALAALRRLVEDGFGEMEEVVPAPVRAPEVRPEAAPIVMLGVEPRGEMRRLSGLAASPGIAIGPAYVYQPGKPAVERRTVENPPAEWSRFLGAIEQAQAQLRAIHQRALDEVGPAAAEIFTAHQLFLQDPALLEQVRGKIVDEGWNAEAALVEAAAGYADLLRGMDDELLRQRAADVEDVSQRVLRILLGLSGESLAQLPEPAIVVAADLTPSDTAQLDKERALGFCTAGGGLTSHTTILARSLGLPAVVGLGEDALSLSPGTSLIVDGEAGLVIANPDEAALTTYFARQQQWWARQEAARRAAQEPAVTRDGRRVEVVANVADLASARAALAHGAEGIGLLRTEFLYLNRDTMPDEEEQYAAYRAILEVMGERPVIIRTLDIGGDKPAPYLAIGEELNPFLGWRAIRLSLGRPEAFKPQLRAILRAGHGRNVKVMFPMITDLAELQQAKALLREAQAELAAEGVPYIEDLEVGIMVETPAAAIAADVLAQEADFFSIGTNDLVQYTMACDRTNERVAYLYQPLHPALLRLIKNVVDAAHQAGKWVGICGEMAGDEKAVPLLLGLGLDEFSMTSSAIPTVKSLIRSLSLAEAQALAREALGLATAAEVSACVEKAFAHLTKERG